ncbi:YajQ family cyclic di-GMP-binding protein [bacterium (Candidatus Howlettbacteria) CG_4_10_14_0_8_um_filter_40_9]|nr:MAG: YajQ family cyclic di-GMP-binding protein [bacterium (Candidatus Howlettbacteria) CG_4_10_14_0_8_um_filter_40_9]
MAKDFSFDIVSDFDPQEMTNALDQTQREIANRYDFKGTNSKIDFLEGSKDELLLLVDSEYKLTALIDILSSKMISRGLSLKILDLSSPNEEASGNMVRKKIKLLKGLDQEKAKKVTKLIREDYPKAKANIQGDTVRVSSAKKDELQEIMTLLKSAELDFPLQFENYR